MLMGQIVTPAELARERGISRPAVLYAMKSRIAEAIVEVDGKRMLDRDKALALWELNTRKRKPSPPKTAVAFTPEGAMADPSKVPDYNASRAAHEFWKAQLAQLQAQERRGELMEQKRHHSLMFKYARATRDMVLAIPARIVDELAVIADVLDPAKRFAMQELLDRELNQALSSLAEQLERGDYDGDEEEGEL